MTESNIQLNSMQKVRKRRSAERIERINKMKQMINGGITDIELIASELGIAISTVKLYLKDEGINVTK